MVPPKGIEVLQASISNVSNDDIAVALYRLFWLVTQAQELQSMRMMYDISPTWQLKQALKTLNMLKASLKDTKKMSERRFESNEEFMHRMMTESSYGSLAQAFVIEALASYAKLVIDAPVVEGGLINMHTWRNIALEVNREIDKKYSGNSGPKN